MSIKYLERSKMSLVAIFEKISSDVLFVTQSISLWHFARVQRKLLRYSAKITVQEPEIREAVASVADGLYAKAP